MPRWWRPHLGCHPTESVLLSLGGLVRRGPALQRSNLAVAAATGVMYLEASNLPVKPTREDAIALRDLLRDPGCTATRIAALLRTWPQAT